MTYNHVEQLASRAMKIARCWHRYAPLLEVAYEDVRQTAYLAAVEAAVSGREGRKEFARLVNKELWKLGRELGFPGFVQVGQEDRTPERCCVKGCDRQAPYWDRVLGGRVCRRHYSLIYRRRKRGWADPYRGVVAKHD